MMLEGTCRRMRRSMAGISLVGMIFIILINVAFVHSSIIGTMASAIYFGLLGFLLGKVLFRDEDEVFTRFLLGLFISISLFILIGPPLVLLYELNFLSLAFVLCAPLALLAIYIRLNRRDIWEKTSKQENIDRVPYFSPIYIVPLVLIAYCEFLLASARSGWVYGTVWDVLSASFFPTYFLAALSLVGIILYSKTKSASKIFLTIIFSLLSTTISAVVFSAGDFGDPLGHMAYARLIYDLGSLRRGYPLGVWYVYWLLKSKGLAFLTGAVTKMFMVDLLWVHVFITPVLWGVFIPLTSYKIAKMIFRSERVSVLAAFLSTFYSSLIVWGSISTANSLGFIVFFVSLYFLLRYMKIGRVNTLLPTIITTLACVLAHFLPGAISLSFLFFALALRKYQGVKLRNPKGAAILLSLAFLACIFVLPFVLSIKNVIYGFATFSVSSEEITLFSFQKLLQTDLWKLIFGLYTEYSFQDLIHWGMIPFLGIIGVAFAMRKSDRYSTLLTRFMLFALMLCIIDHRIMEYAMINVPFGPGRITYARDLILIPFAALTIFSSAKFLEGTVSKTSTWIIHFKKWALRVLPRKVAAGLLVGLALSAFAVSSTQRSYTHLGGLHPTELEVEAVKYIDENTDGRYIVISSMPDIGCAFVGMWNPQKYYVYSSYLAQNPSVETMVEYIGEYEAGVGYYVASFRTPNFDEAVAEASRIFGLFKIFSNEYGEIDIFRYEIPPLPTGPEVMALYWDTPPSYIVQNELMRVTFKPSIKSLEVVDYWGKLYERVDLNKALTDGNPIGNLTFIEYFEPLNETWTNWNPHTKIEFSSALAQQFKFRLCFENESLIVIVERDKPSVQLLFLSARESTLSLQIGDFSRLYIPGLVGGNNPYNVSSLNFGLLYTASLTNSVKLHPGYKYETDSLNLTLGQIRKHCGLTITEGYLWYDFWVQNEAERGQWGYVEVWLPDEIYSGISPPISYSTDNGETWISVKPRNDPIRTLEGVDVRWVVTCSRSMYEQPQVWSRSRSGEGESFKLPENFTDSGGGQNRLIFGLYLPAGDKALVRLAVSMYGYSSQKITYVFNDCDNVSYGLRNMNSTFIKFYDYGTDSYMGGVAVTKRPTTVAITEDKGKMKSILIATPSNTTISLLSGKGVDTTTDIDGDKIPDILQEPLEH